MLNRIIRAVKACSSSVLAKASRPLAEALEGRRLLTGDPQFLGAGYYNIDAPAYDQATAVAPLSSGGAVVAGSSEGRIFLAWYDAAGARTGLVVTPQRGVVSSMAIADGKIIVAGSNDSTLDPDLAVFRFNGDGSVDTSFDVDGVAVVPLEVGAPDRAAAVAVEAGGGIVVAGYSEYSPALDVVRLSDAGIHEATLINPATAWATPTGIAVAESGRIYVGGHDFSGFVLAAYTSIGEIDTGFGVAGAVNVAAGSGTSVGLAILPSGNVAMAGNMSPEAVTYIERDSTGASAIGTEYVNYGVTAGFAARAMALDGDAVLVAGSTGSGEAIQMSVASIDALGGVSVVVAPTIGDAFAVAATEDAVFVAGQYGFDGVVATASSADTIALTAPALEIANSAATASDGSTTIVGVTHTIDGDRLTVIRIDANGQVAWRHDGEADPLLSAMSLDVAVDGEGNTYVVGQAGGSFVIKFDATGTDVAQATDAVAAYRAVAVGGGYVYVGGTTTNATDGTSDFAVVRYDAGLNVDGTWASGLLSATAGPGIYDAAYDMFATSDTVVLGGSSLLVVDTGTASATRLASPEGLLIESVEADGATVLAAGWLLDGSLGLARFDLGAGSGSVIGDVPGVIVDAWDISVDNAGGIVVAGTAWAADFSATDALVAWFDAEGNLAGTLIGLPGAGAAAGTSLAVGVAAGASGEITVVGSANEDFIVARYGQEPAEIPTVTLSGPIAGVTQQPLEYGAELSVTGWATSVSWRVTDAAGVEVAAASTEAFTFTPTAAGAYTITFTATNGVGSVSATMDVAVSATAIIEGTLLLGGTTGADNVSILPFAGRLYIRSNGSWIAYDYASVTGAVLYGGAGNDQVFILPWLNVPVTVYGGAGDDQIHTGNGGDIIFGGEGNDTLRGRDGDDILVGGPGHDLLFGGDGRDLLIGGDGADRIVGNTDDDILIAGPTAHDDNEAALDGIRDVWSGSGTAAVRADALKLGALTPDQDVFTDEWSDVLTGNQGSDWFIYDLNADLGMRDRVTDMSRYEAEFDADVSVIYQEDELLSPPAEL